MDEFLFRKGGLNMKWVVLEEHFGTFGWTKGIHIENSEVEAKNVARILVEGFKEGYFHVLDVLPLPEFEEKHGKIETVPRRILE